jgi:CrcB protein
MRPGLLHVILVGCGGFVGAVLRYGVGGLVHRSAATAGFPFGTLVVNVAGCLLIGAAAAAAETRQLLGPEARLFLMVGVLGGFTTFSTFGYETLALVRDGEMLRAALNVTVHVVLGLAAVWMGYSLIAAR